MEEINTGLDVAKVAAGTAECGEKAEPLVSVIVGVFNKERFVGECLRSVLAQTYRNWELIVVDDASTDGSLAEAERILAGDCRTHIIRRQKNSGHPGAARNQGLVLAKGKYVAFLDADDTWHGDKLAQQIAYMEEHPEYPLSHTVCEEIGERGEVLRVRHGGELPKAGNCLAALFAHCFICTSTVMARRDFGQKIGWFTEDPGYRCGEDYDFFVRCAQVAEFGMIPRALAGYRNIRSSISHRDENWKNTPTDYERKAFFLRRSELWRGHLKEKEMRLLLWQSALENCQYWRARKAWRRAAWFACQALRLRPMAAASWRQLGGTAFGRA